MGTAPYDDDAADRDELAALVEERDALARENGALKGRRDALQRRVRDLNEKLDAHLRRIAELEAGAGADGESAKVRAERDALVTERDDLVRKLGAHSARSAELEERMGEVQARARSLVTERDELRRRVAAIDEERLELDRLAEVHERDVAAAARKIEPLERRNADLDQQVRELAERAKRLSAERDRLLTEQADSTGSEEVARLRAAHEKARKELLVTKAEAAELTVRVEELTDQAAFDQRHLAVHSAERRKLFERATAAEARASEAEAALGEHQRLLQDLSAEREALVEQAELQAGRVKQLEAVAARRRDRIETLEESLREHEVRLADAGEQIDTLNREFADEADRARQAVARIEGEARRRTELETERGHLVARLDRLEDANVELTVERDGLAEGRREITGQRDALLEERDRLARERADLAARIQAKERDLAAAEHDRAEAWAAVEAGDRLAADAEARHKRAVADLDKQRAAAAKLQGKLKELETGLAERETGLASLRSELEGVRAHAEELRATIGAARERADAADSSLARAADERRLLIAELARAQNEAAERDDRIDELLSGRWYVLASASWRLRKQRKRLAVVALASLGVLTGLGVAAALGVAWPIVAGAAIVALATGAALAWRAVGAAARRPARPRRRSAVLPLGEGETVAAVGAPDETTATPAQPAPQEDAPRMLVTKLVPAPTGAVAIDLERQSFLSGAVKVDVRDLRVAGILDEMSRACFAPECDLFCDFTMEDWREKLEAHPPHLLLVESAWSGNSGGWQYGVGSYTHPHYVGLPKLRALLEWCRERSIPTVFWNKEDPVHFDKFKEAAALFDHILTTDENCIPAYGALGGLDVKSVGALPFAAQPRLHNPIAIVDERRSEPVFAGTYYRTRHVDRRKSLETILDAARPFGLIIYDRTFGTESEEYGFPERFLPHVAGRLPYDKVIDVYKSHRLFVNVNSVVDSPTMFSRRVFELMACGTAVVSTESVGIEAMFGDLVPVAHTLEDATAAIERLLGDDAYHADLTLRARRLVLAEHTYRQRLCTIARTAGYDASAGPGDDVAVVALADDAADLRALAQKLLAQSVSPREVVIGTSNAGGVEGELVRLTERLGDDAVRLSSQDGELPRDERYRELGGIVSAPWVAPMNGRASYAPDHLRDLAAVTVFAHADVVGAPLLGRGGREHRYAEVVDPAAALASRDVVARHGWAEDGGSLASWFGRGVRFYAGDRVARAVPAAVATDNGAPRERERRIRVRKR
ncbi:MAG TPA: glycosyltransferase [Thermoleophilaceae bacterium]|nr:glycosyltransferase [Thermoleophilaceae bacterium]